MNKKNLVRYKAGLAALMIASGMTLSGCGSSYSNGFELTVDKDRSLVAREDSYVNNRFIERCFVVEARSNLNGDSNIYFATKTRLSNFAVDSDNYQYCDIFTNNAIFTNNNEINTSFEFINEVPLYDYLVSLDMVKGLYSYEDMKKIYDEVKSVYTFEEEKELVK